jgi:hypothetical protein
MSTDYRAKAFADPARGRWLYRELDGEEGVYLYAGFTHRRCSGCQGYPTDRQRCSFCGHVEAPDAATH